MSDRSGSTRRPERVNGRSGDIGLVQSIDFTRTLERGAGDPSDQLILGLETLHAQQRGSENGQHSEFITVISHELRNSLNAIRCATRALHTDASADPAAVKARALIERQVGRMAHLVEDLLDVSRVRSGHLRLQRQRMDLCTVAAHAVQSVEFGMQERHHRMTTAFPEAPVWVRADPDRLEQVLVNLLANAAKYTEAGGKVVLSVEQGEQEATVRIRDTGIGISADVLPHIFDLFVQANPTAGRTNAGLGIGLALVRSLVELHGGRITAASAGLGQGSEFAIHLPLGAE
jgi:signal transduction histidine kinase